MKSVAFIFAALMTAVSAYGDEWPADSLKISKNLSLDEVVVTAVKAASGTPVAYTDVTAEDLDRRNHGQGIPYLISTTPSVVMTSDAGTGIGYSGFRVRGTDANRINITVNGVPLNDAESHTVFWVNMPDFASSVQNVQIQRGAGTSTNGAAAFGATVAMQTQKPEMEPYAEYSIAAGSFGTVKHMAKGGTGLLYDHFLFDARYSDIRSDGFIDRARARMRSYFISAAWYGSNTLLKFQTFGSSEETYQAWNGVPDSMLQKGNRTFNPCGMYYDDSGQIRFYNDQTDNYRQQHYHLMLSQRIGLHWNTNVTLHYTPGEGYYEDYRYDKKYSDYKLPDYTDGQENVQKKSDFIRRKWLDSDFYGGIFSAIYQRERLQLTLGGAVNNYVCDHFGRIMWAKTSQALPQPDYEYYRNKGEKLDYSAYVKANWLFHPRWNAYLDLQYRGIDYTIKGSDDKAGDHVNIHKDWHFFNPKIGLNYSHRAHNAFASFSVANREPGRDNFTEATASEHPTHETLYDYEAGYSFRSRDFHVAANLYFMDYKDQLILSGKISEIGEALTSNIKDSYRMGLELSGGVTIASWLQWDGNITFSRNKIRHFTEYVDDWDTGQQRAHELGTTHIAFSPDLTANSLFHFRWRALSAGFTSQYVGRQYIDNTSNKDRSVDPYFINSLQLGYSFSPKFMEKISVDVVINNIFNEKYETNAWVYSYYEGGTRKKDSGYFTQAGTNAMARVTLAF